MSNWYYLLQSKRVGIAHFSYTPDSTTRNEDRFV